MTDAAELEALDNPTLFARRHELDRDALLASRVRTWPNSWLDDKTDEYLGDLPALAGDDDAAIALERAVAEPMEACSGFVRHLCRRLVRRPNLRAIAPLRALRERVASDAAAAKAYGEAVGLASLACDRDAVIAPLCAEVGTASETLASLCAVFLSDPTGAFDQLGDRLALGAVGDAYARRARLLRVLVADGIPDLVLPCRCTHPLGFVAADARWAAALSALAADKTLFETKRALANASPEQLAAIRPTKKAAKPTLEARLVAWGSVAYEELGALPVPFDVRTDRVMIATSPRTVTVRRLAAGLPLVADVTLPGDRRFATDAVGPYDSPYEASGVLDAVLHPDGEAIAIVAHGEVLLVGLDGVVRAEAVLDDTLLHRACFGPDGKTLWLATNDDDGHAVTALDGASLAVLGRTKRLGEFPDPAFFTAHPHPSDDVGVFAVMCGQDGAWVKVIERTAKGPAPRKQKLHASSGHAELYGFGAGVAASGVWGSSKLTLRSWPELASTKSKQLEGECRGGVVIGDDVYLAIAELTDAPSKLAIHALADGARRAEAPWPAGEQLIARQGALATTSERGVTLYGVELPEAPKKRGPTKGRRT